MLNDKATDCHCEIIELCHSSSGRLLIWAFLGWGAEIQKIKIIYEVKINITTVQV